MKQICLLLLLGVAKASQDPYECIPDEGCMDQMDCLMREVTETRNTDLYKNARNDDPTLAIGEPSYWCIPEEWTKPALMLNGEWDDSNDTKSIFEKIVPEVIDPNAELNAKAYVAGITCEEEEGWCPYEDMTCVGRHIVKVNPDSAQYQKMVKVDPTFSEDTISFWCVTKDIFKIGMEWNGKMNDAWGVEMKMWEVMETLPEKETRAAEIRGEEIPVAPKIEQAPGGEITDTAGNTIVWDDEEITFGNAGTGTITIKMSAITLATTIIGAATVMSTIC